MLSLHTLDDMPTAQIRSPPGVCRCLTCGQHDGRVAVIGAADNGSDDHRAVREAVLRPLVQERDRNSLLLLGYVEALKTHLNKQHKNGWPRCADLNVWRRINVCMCVTFSFRQLMKSSFMQVTATLSCGRLGPLTWGTMELRFISMTYDTMWLTYWK